MPLRDYQQKSIDLIRSGFIQHRRLVLHMATGGGKTAIFCEMLRLAYKKGTSCLVVVRGRKLIMQASARLTSEGVPHGVIMAGRDSGHHELIQVCSVDTIASRSIKLSAKLLIIDECHQTYSPRYLEIIKQYPDSKILGVSATPYLKTGLRHIADAVIAPITAEELTKKGYLVPLRYFSCETPDLSGIKTTAGDYNEHQLDMVMQEAAITGCPEEHYKRIADGRPALMFAVSVKHSQILVDRFNRAGIASEHIDAKSPDDVRQEAIRRLECGEIKVLSNVGIMGTGVDIPCLGAIIMCRPTKSYNLWIQVIGRGTRTCEGKKDCIILDHAGNSGRHGFLTTHIPANLDPVSMTRKAFVSKIKDCQYCLAVNYRSAIKCRECGEIFNPPNKNERIVNEKNGELIELTRAAWEYDFDRLHQTSMINGWKPGAIYHRIKEKYGDKIARLAWVKLQDLPTWELRTSPPVVATPTQNLSTTFDSKSEEDEMFDFGKIPPVQASHPTDAASRSVEKALQTCLASLTAESL